MADTGALQVIVITGCSTGIGLATAVLLSNQNGYKVIATMRNLAKKGELEKAAGERLNTTLFIRELDISKEESILQFLKQTYDREGRIDVLVNNAAMGQFGIFEHFRMNQMQSLFQTNVLGTAKITQEVVREMKKRKSGKIIFVGSLGGITPVPFNEFYVASKYAVEGLAASLAPYLRCFNIWVTSVQPGPVQTQFCDNVQRNNMGSGNWFANHFEEDPNGDEETNLYMKNVWSTMGAQVREHIQPVGEVAHVIKKCIEDDQPSVKVQTNADGEATAKATLVDPSGNGVNDVIIGFLKGQPTRETYI